MRFFFRSYLNSDKVYYVLGIICISVICTYIQQEYAVIPQIKEQPMLSDSMKMQIIEQFSKYRWISFVFSPLIILLRITLVACCFYIGGLLFDSFGRQKYKDCFNIALKADVILIASSVLYAICIIEFGMETSTNVIQNTSLLGLFDVTKLEPWLLILIETFSIFELIYWLLLAKLLSVALKKKYSESMNFVFSTYGVGLVLYILLMIFVILYITN